MLPPKTSLAAPYYRLLHRLWTRGPAAVPAVFGELGLARTVGSKLVAQMAEEGVVDAGTEVALRPDYGSVVGLHLGTGGIDAAVTNFVGEVLVTQTLGYPAGPLPQAVHHALAALEPRLRPPGVPPVRGLALSLPGVVDPHRLVLVHSTPLGITGPVDLRETLARPWGRPVSADNDANCCCWGEAALRRGGPRGNFLCLLAELRPYGRGEDQTPYQNFAVGLGLYLNGAVYHGDRFSAGEFQSLFKTNPHQRNQFSISDEAMARASFDAGVEETVASELARHAAFLVNTLDLDAVYVSWPNPRRADAVLDLVREEIRCNGSYRRDHEVTVSPPSRGYGAPAFGAAALHLESLFQPIDGPAPYSSQPRPGFFR